VATSRHAPRDLAALLATVVLVISSGTIHLAGVARERGTVLRCIAGW
jgi:heme/copper-type cytochrome/quinol oxidase subunit 3